jgi:hypothetical protein
VLRLPLRAALESGAPRTLLALCRKVAELKRDLSPELVHVNGGAYMA